MFQIIFNPKIIIPLAIFGAVCYSGWLFWWPIIECTYAMSLVPLLESELKLGLFVLGGIIFWPATYAGVRFVI